MPSWRAGKECPVFQERHRAGAVLGEAVMREPVYRIVNDEMSDVFGRLLTIERKSQGFKSQDHLDAFYAAFDHTSTCPVCSRVSGYVPYDDGLQPVMGRCDTGRQLEAVSFKF